jgi:hypothetical protein
MKHTVGLLWTSDQLVVEASTYTGQNTTYKRKKLTSMRSAGFEPAMPATKRPHIYALTQPLRSAYPVLLNVYI